MRGFTKGLFTGAIIGGSIAFMMEPCTAHKIKKIRKKANRTMKNVGYMIEGYMNGK